MQEPVSVTVVNQLPALVENFVFMLPIISPLQKCCNIAPTIDAPLTIRMYLLDFKRGAVSSGSDYRFFAPVRLIWERWKTAM